MDSVFLGIFTQCIVCQIRKSESSIYVVDEHCFFCLFLLNDSALFRFIV